MKSYACYHHARRKDDKKRKDKRTAFFRHSMGIKIYRKADYKAMKTQIKKCRSAAMVKIDIYIHLRKKIAYRFKSVYCYNLLKRKVFFFFLLYLSLFFSFSFLLLLALVNICSISPFQSRFSFQLINLDSALWL